MIKYKYFVLLYALQDVILERKKKTKKIDLSRLKVATKSKSRLQQVRRGRSGRIREKSRLSKPTHGRSSCGNTSLRYCRTCLVNHHRFMPFHRIRVSKSILSVV